MTVWLPPVAVLLAAVACSGAPAVTIDALRLPAEDGGPIEVGVGTGVASDAAAGLVDAETGDAGATAPPTADGGTPPDPPDDAARPSNDAGAPPSTDADAADPGDAGQPPPFTGAGECAAVAFGPDGGPWAFALWELDGSAVRTPIYDSNGGLDPAAAAFNPSNAWPSLADCFVPSSTAEGTFNRLLCQPGAVPPVPTGSAPLARVLGDGFSVLCSSCLQVTTPSPECAGEPEFTCENSVALPDWGVFDPLPDAGAWPGCSVLSHPTDGEYNFCCALP